MILTSNICYDPRLQHFLVQLLGELKIPTETRRIYSRLRSTLAEMFCWVALSQTLCTKQAQINSHPLMPKTIALAIQRLQGITLGQEVDRHKSGQTHADNTLKILSNKKFRKHHFVSVSILISRFLRITEFRISQNRKNVRWKIKWGGSLLVERDLLQMTD